MLVSFFNFEMPFLSSYHFHFRFRSYAPSGAKNSFLGDGKEGLPLTEIYRTHTTTIRASSHAPFLQNIDAFYIVYMILYDMSWLHLNLEDAAKYASSEGRKPS